MKTLLLTSEECDYLELLLHNHEYEEKDRKLIDKLEVKFYKLKSEDYQNKVTTIGGKVEDISNNSYSQIPSRY